MGNDEYTRQERTEAALAEQVRRALEACMVEEEEISRRLAARIAALSSEE